MKKMHWVVSLLAAGILALVVCQGALAESGKPIAGVLDSITPYGEFTFKSAGNQILFAEILTAFQRRKGRPWRSHRRVMAYLHVAGRGRRAFSSSLRHRGVYTTRGGLRSV